MLWGSVAVVFFWFFGTFTAASGALVLWRA